MARLVYIHSGGKTRLPTIACPRLISHLDIALPSKHLSARGWNLDDLGVGVHHC